MKLPNDVKELKVLVRELVKDNKSLQKDCGKLSKALCKVFEVSRRLVIADSAPPPKPKK